MVDENDSPLSPLVFAKGAPAQTDDLNHSARFGEYSGLLLHLDTRDYTDVRRSYDWETLGSDPDQDFVAGWFAGSVTFDSHRIHDFHALGPSWGSWSELQRGHDPLW